MVLILVIWQLIIFFMQSFFYLTSEQLLCFRLFQFDEMLISCMFKRSIHCRDLFTTTETPLGLCYTFNSYDLVKSRGPLLSYHPGASNGLYLRLNVNQSQYFSSLTASAGFRVNMDECMDGWING